MLHELRHLHHLVLVHPYMALSLVAGLVVDVAFLVSVLRRVRGR